jgi:hypothetical protein
MGSATSFLETQETRLRVNILNDVTMDPRKYGGLDHGEMKTNPVGSKREIEACIGGT